MVSDKLKAKLNTPQPADEPLIIFRIADTKGQVVPYYYHNGTERKYNFDINPVFVGDEIIASDWDASEFQKNLTFLERELVIGIETDDIKRSDIYHTWFFNRFLKEKAGNFINFVKVFQREIAERYPEYILGDLLVPDDWVAPVLEYNPMAEKY